MRRCCDALVPRLGRGPPRSSSRRARGRFIERRNELLRAPEVFPFFERNRAHSRAFASSRGTQNRRRFNASIGETAPICGLDPRRRQPANRQWQTPADCSKRRAWDSNPQPVTRHLISSQTANRSRTLPRTVFARSGIRPLLAPTHRCPSINRAAEPKRPEAESAQQTVSRLCVVSLRINKRGPAKNSSAQNHSPNFAESQAPPSKRDIAYEPRPLLRRPAIGSSA